MHVRVLSRLAILILAAFTLLSCERPSTVEPPPASPSIESGLDPLASYSIPSPTTNLYWRQNALTFKMQDGRLIKIWRSQNYISSSLKLKVLRYINGTWRHQVTIDQVRNSSTRFYSARLTRPDGSWIRISAAGALIESYDPNCKYGCDASYNGTSPFTLKPSVCLVSTSAVGECDTFRDAAVIAGHSMFINGLITFGFWALSGPVTAPIQAKFAWAAAGSGVAAFTAGIAYIQCRKQDRDSKCGDGDDVCDNSVYDPRIIGA